MNNDKMNKARRIKRSSYSILEGALLEKLFQGRSLKYLIVTFVVSLIMIISNYTSTALLRDIENLRGEVKELKLEQITVSSSLVQSTRFTTVETRVREANLDINGAGTAPIFLD